MHRERVLSDSPGKTLLHMTIPTVVGLLAIIGFNVADTFFIGQLGADQLAAIGFISPIIMIFNFMALGLGIGAASVMSRAIGRNDQQQVRRYGTDSLILSLIIVAIFILIGFLVMRPLFLMMGASEHIYGYIKEYMQIWFSGMIFIVVPMVGNSCIRATGDTKTPAVIMSVAAITNVILDPIFIFGLLGAEAMGIRGAAFATVLARAITMFASLYFLIFKYKLIDFRIHPLGTLIDSWRKILHIGIPASATHLLIPLYMTVLTAIVASYGSEAVAAYGIATKIESVALIVLIGLSSSMVPFVGQNYGAGKLLRVHDALNKSYIFSLCWGILLFILFYYFATPILAKFSDDGNIIAKSSTYLILVSVSFGAIGIRLMVNSAFNALGKPLWSSFVVIFNLFGACIPLALLFSLWKGIDGVFLGNMIGNLLAGFVSFLTAYYFIIRKLIRR